MNKYFILLACLALLCKPAAAASQVTIRVKGADTMIHLAEAWAAKFRQIHPDINIVVTGGGSQPGIAALLSGAADIADTARPVEKAENQAAQGHGFELVEYAVALDGITVIVNPAIPVYVLSLPQLKKIFTGEADNWKNFGGPDQKIHLFIRDADSGTFVFFQKHVLQKSAYSPRAKVLPSNAAIIQAITFDQAGIGYVGYGYYANAQGEVRAMRIHKDEKSLDLTPNTETVADGSYPISHKLRMVTKGPATGAVKQFVDFVTGDFGQGIVASLGFVKLPKPRPAAQ